MASEEKKKRLGYLERLEIMDSEFEEDYDNIIWMASKMCDMPIALISLLDDRRQWFKAKVGLKVRETPIEYSFCHHACSTDQNSSLDVFIVENARENNLFKTNPLVTSEPNIVFYAGMPIITNDNTPLGTVCVIDRKPRKLSENQIECLRILSKQVSNLFELALLRKELSTAINSTD